MTETVLRAAPPTVNVRQDVRALEFEDSAASQRWCTAEAQNIVALVRFAVNAGYFEYAMQIPQLVGQIWLRQGLAAELAGLDLGHEVPFRGDRTVSARWVLAHVIEEAARHAGHLDVVRELLDGTTGD